MVLAHTAFGSGVGAAMVMSGTDIATGLEGGDEAVLARLGLAGASPLTVSPLVGRLGAE